MNEKDDERPKSVFEMIARINSGEINPAQMYKGTAAESVVNDGAVPQMIKKALIRARSN